MIKRVIKNQSWQSWHKIAFFIGLATLVYFESDARVGGGDSYGGGYRRSNSGGSYSGGNGGDGGFLLDLIFSLLRLCFRYPKIGIPLLLIALTIAYFYYRNNHRHDNYYSSYGTEAYHPVVINKTRDYVAKIREYDSQFSFPIFKDFVFSLYHTYHEYRGANKLYALSAFFDPKFLANNSSVGHVDGIVIGNCTISRATINAQNSEMTIEVGFSANYTEVDRKGQNVRYKLSETWKLKKSTKTLSLPPEKSTAQACPNCGAPVTETISGLCGSCGTSNVNGRFQWFVFDIISSREVLKQTTSIEKQMGVGLVDYGVNLPTLRDPSIQALITKEVALKNDYTHLQTRAEKIFIELQKAWSQKNWSLARPYETDTLFHSHHFWIEDFKRNGQTNYIENPKIERLEPVSLFKDNYYMSFTFRIFASMVDYTIDRQGSLVRGNKKQPVRFSEYWTFIKGVNDNLKAAKTKDFDLCPSCGAQIKIEMSGQCEYCGTKVTLGQFDWVLSQIEQDEEFTL